MPEAKGEAGDLSSESKGGFVGATGQGIAGEIRMQAGSPVFQVKSNLTAEVTVIRGPFSEALIAERLSQNPQFYARLFPPRRRRAGPRSRAISGSRSRRE